MSFMNWNLGTKQKGFHVYLPVSLEDVLPYSVRYPHLSEFEYRLKNRDSCQQISYCFFFFFVYPTSFYFPLFSNTLKAEEEPILMRLWWKEYTWNFHQNWNNKMRFKNLIFFFCFLFDFRNVPKESSTRIPSRIYTQNFSPMAVSSEWNLNI